MPKPSQLGLTSTTAAEKLRRYGPNVLPEQQSRSTLHIFLTVLKEPMITLLIISGTIYFLIGDIVEALLLAIMIGFVALITFFQEKRTEQALSALKQLSDPKVKVIRDNREQIIQSYQLVPGDVVVVTEGNRIPADGTIIDTRELYVDEAAITGESLPICKKNQDQVFSGTLVTSGTALIHITQTGVKTKIGDIGNSLNQINESPTRLQLETRQIIVRFAALGFIVCLIAIIGIWLNTNSFIHALLQGIAIAMSLLPEEFPVVITIFTALGALRIAQKRVLMSNLPTLETLGSTTVLCTDKTGTLTQNQMTVTGVVTPAGSIENPYEHKLSSAAISVLRLARLACHVVITDNMEVAIDNAYQIVTDTHLPQIEEISSLKQNHTYMINRITYGNNRHQFVTKGAPEAVLALCKLPPPQREQVIQQAKTLARRGSRVLAIATHSQLSGTYAYQGMIALSDPIRPGVKKAIQDCYQAGIRIIMITGDYPETAKAIGESIGLTGNHNILTGEQIAHSTPQQLRQQLKAANICARILPAQKLQIVEALKQNGEIVAMTGDGVNDAPALKAAHMGIAMGLKGTDVAREAADMILTDDNFVSIVNAIRDGRRIYTNIRKAVGFIIAVHVPIALLATIPSFLGWPLILTPVHIVVLELLIDPACTLVFENEPPDADAMHQPPRPPQQKLFNRQVVYRGIMSGLAVACAVLAAYVASSQLSTDPTVIRTIAFSTLIYSNLGLILSYRSDKGSIAATLRIKNLAFWWVIISISSLMTALVLIPRLQQLFKFSAPTLSNMFMIVIFSILSFLLESIITKRSATIRA